jgi:PAS domain S-box-containing protein
MAARSDPDATSEDASDGPADADDRPDVRPPTGGNQDWLRDVVDTLAEGIVVMDRTGRIIDANPAAHRIFRAQPGELVDHPRPMDLWKVVGDDGRPIPKEQWPSFISPGRRTRQLGVTLGVEALDGSVVWIELNTLPVRDQPGGSLTMVVASFRDVTEEREAKEELEFRTRLLDAAGNAIMATDVSGEIIYWNQGAEELYGWRADEALGQHILDLLAGENMERRMEEIVAALETQGRWFGEVWVKDRHGYLFPVLVASTALLDDDGALVAIIAVVTDISERVQAEKDAAEANRKLTEARRIAERKDFERIVAERANQAKSEFLSRMSHELRTPLNAVLGFTQLLQRRDLAEEDLESVTYIHRAGMHLLDLINEVLDIARIEQNQLSMTIEPVLIGDIVRSSIELIGPTAADHQVTVLGPEGINDSLRVMADRQRSIQVLLNLLSNAVKYGRPGGLTQVLVVPAGIGGVRVSVVDTGVGIPAEDLEKLWQPFERLGAARRDIEGTGVGLALSHRLVEQMNGRVGVSSIVGEGSTFWFELPRAVDAPLVDLTLVNGALDLADDQTITVVCIEDSETHQHLLQRALGLRPQVRQVFAIDGDTGLEQARHHEPQLIVIDLHEPEAVTAALRRLRHDPATADASIAVVGPETEPALTDQDGEVDRVDAYLARPLDVEHLLGLIDTMLLTRS